MAKEIKKVVGEFTLLGTVKINDYTFDIDKVSQNSAWRGNRAKFHVNCGKDGEIYCETQNSGFFPGKDEKNLEKGSKTLVYAHGKKASKNDDKKLVDDFKNKDRKSGV